MSGLKRVNKASKKRLEKALRLSKVIASDKLDNRSKVVVERIKHGCHVSFVRG